MTGARFDELWPRLLAMPHPYLPESMRGDDHDIDFYDDDRHFAGIATRWAARRQVDVDRITLRGSVNRAVNDAAATDPAAAEELVRYWSLMVATAEALSRESGVPFELVEYPLPGVAQASLVEALELLSSSAPQQTASLDWTAKPDGLARAFELSWEMLDPESTMAQLPAVRRVRRELSELRERNDPLEWENDALDRSPAWERLRASAREALAALRLEPGGDG